MEYDLIIHNGLIITGNEEFDIIENGIICIKNTIIQKIGQKKDNIKLPYSAQVIDANQGLIIPGLVNTHTHLPMSLFRGLADDLPLMTWLNKYIFPAEASQINPESVNQGSILSCAELLLSGTTTCCDGYFYENYVAEAVYSTGLRAVLGQGIIDFPAPGVPDPEKNISYALAFIEKWQKRYNRIKASVFCHSPYTCSKNTLIKAKEMANQFGVLFQIHTAETKTEHDTILSEHNLSPVKYLHKLGLLDSNTLLVHCVWTDKEDIQIIADTHAKISTAVESNMKLASGIAPVPDFLKNGIVTGVGTDSCASNNDLDMFSEMDTLGKIHKLAGSDPVLMDAKLIFKMATLGGAEAIGLKDEIGSLESGKKADIVIIDMNKPHLVPVYDPVSHIIYNVKGSDVNNVIIDGKIIVKNRQVQTIDIKKFYTAPYFSR